MRVLPETITRMRKRRGMTQAELARAVGVSQAYIARLENGTLDPKLSVVNRILDVLEGSTLTCADVMSTNLVVADARDSALEVVRDMLRNGFSQIPVLRAGKIVGMVTERDVVRNITRDLEQMSVQAIMETVSPPLVDERTKIEEVIALLDTFQAVLVHRGGRLVGIVARSDIMRALALD